MLHEILIYAVVAMCLWAILAPAIPTCILGTAGLCCVGIGALLTLDTRMQPAIDVVLIGVLLGGLQVIWRSYKARNNRHMRRVGDWGPEWMRTEAPREVDVTNRQHISGGRK